MTNFVNISLNYYRNLSLISKYKSNLKALLRQGISHPEYYGDVIYKLRKITGHTHFHSLFIKHIKKLIKMAMIQQYYNALHVWWATLLQLAITLPSSLVRQQEYHNTV